MRSTRLRLVLFSAIAIVVAGLIGPATASAAPYCGIYWGSLAKEGTLAGAGPNFVSGFRAGQHECYDRLVIDLDSRGTSHPTTTWRVEYVSQLFNGETDRPLPVRGGALIAIRFTGSTFDPLAAEHTWLPPLELVDVSGFRTFRQVALSEDFENQIIIGLGVRARLPFRVFTLAGSPASPYGARLVIDVAHLW